MISEINDPFEIDKFCNFTNSTLSQISICPEQFRPILLLALLDTLSKAAHPEIRDSNRERFITLIDEFSGWAYGNHVSVVQLSFLLKDESDLKSLVSDSISKYVPGSILRPEDADKPIEELSKHCCEAELPLLERARYVSLLWTMRNSLAHSLKSPGNATRLSKYNSTPYYHYDLGTSSWELHIDAQVLVDLVKAVISNLSDHFEKNGINPYESFSWSSNWFEF